jgi:hypothetical protein
LDYEWVLATKENINEGERPAKQKNKKKKGQN